MSKHKCTICDDVLTSKSALIEHLIDHYEDGSDMADRAEQALDDLDPTEKWRSY